MNDISRIKNVQNESYIDNISKKSINNNQSTNTVEELDLSFENLNQEQVKLSIEDNFNYNRDLTNKFDQELYNRINKLINTLVSDNNGTK